MQRGAAPTSPEPQKGGDFPISWGKAGASRLGRSKGTRIVVSSEASEADPLAVVVPGYPWIRTERTGAGRARWEGAGTINSMRSLGPWDRGTVEQIIHNVLRSISPYPPYDTVWLQLLQFPSR